MADALRRQLEQYDEPMDGPGESKPEKKSSTLSSSAPSTTTTTTPPPAAPVIYQKALFSAQMESPWKNLMRQSKNGPSTVTSSSATKWQTSVITSQPNDCPADVEQLGRSSWTLLHTMAANYPDVATSEQQSDMRNFLHFFTKLYPCWVCGTGFQKWMVNHPPPLNGRGEFGNWMCQAHNVVNRRLGKKEFDCRFWEQRWKVGWEDGRCD
ncbi:hypothetical protein KEM54_005981 [Ascosphaera aggregata]|nr:hypothetical protein KEM54_005981 [Ascosphaera aggregata]